MPILLDFVIDSIIIPSMMISILNKIIHSKTQKKNQIFCLISIRIEKSGKKLGP